MQTLSKKQQNRLIYIAFIMYSSVYAAKLNYGALMVEIMAEFGTSRSVAGLVSSFFFFAYGVGQIVFGFLMKYLNEKYFMSGALFLAGVCNLLMTVVSGVDAMKYIWLVNGIVLSCLWCSLIKVTGKYISGDNLPKALTYTGLTTPIGTALNYGICALVAYLGNWRYSFWFSAISMFIIAAVWFWTLSDMERLSVGTSLNTDSESQPETAQNKPTDKKGKTPIGVKLMIVMLAVFLTGLAVQYVRDGLNSWVPSILNEVYLMPTTLSIALTLLLPLLSSFGNVILVELERKTKNFLTLTLIFIIAEAVMAVTLVACFGLNSMIITLVCFIVICIVSNAILNIATNHMPLYFRDRFDSARLAGIGQGCCYLGSTLSTYTLGLVADNGGWFSVFKLMCIIALAVTVLCIVARILYGFKKHPIKHKFL